ncbi:hypothetical protein NP233_g1440 [Leucocoprinus birnbaumii]|uniref:Uncharacterized protein n=1 Tax=Leucocoprinus birnbaumii TaxID=56174 RepID=A0AAD5W0Z5_9AGAR|nr:hypothetical protein NP233_g1440 [Leucocoprinus birnbaumii]
MNQAVHADILSAPDVRSAKKHEENEAPSRRFGHVAAPKLVPKLLPPCPSDNAVYDQDIGAGNVAQLLPDCLLFQNEAWPSVSGILAFQNRNRYVAQPTITFMPEYPGYLWGGVTSYIDPRDDGLRVHFEEVTEPATNPAVRRMRILASSSGSPNHWLEVSRREDTPFVMVADVQRTVIEWMKETSLSRPVNASPRLSNWITLTDEDGKEFDLEVWIWRGLEALDDTMENWVLKLADDAVGW